MRRIGTLVDERWGKVFVSARAQLQGKNGLTVQKGLI